MTPEPSAAGQIAVRAPGGDYAIELGCGLLAQAGERLRAWGLTPGPVAVVSEDRVARHYADPLSTALREADFEPTLCLLEGGEINKTLASVAGLYERFAELRLDRRAPVVALGGGVMGDMAGFAAASWLRGVPFVQIPTSLLAMVDSSVGGKTGVDLPAGKNLVGAFKQPRGVLIDPETLATLPAVELCSGLAEVLKHALIADPQLFARLEAGVGDLSGVAGAALVRDAVQVKVDVVQEDPFEQGRRAVLNLGHTFGHAFELLSEFSLRHGEAVGVGLVAAADVAERVGRAEAGLSQRIEGCLATLGLPTRVNFDPAAARAAMGQDKKRRGKTLRFVIVEAVGAVALVDDPGEAVDAALARVCSQS
jgi:shikimate kinase/3-dehydroquinate synthase